MLLTNVLLNTVLRELGEVNTLGLVCAREAPRVRRLRQSLERLWVS